MSNQTFLPFFIDNPAKDWSFDNFCSFLLTKDANTTELHAKAEYQNSLEVIRQSASMSRDLRSRAGQLLCSLKYKKKNKRKVSIPESSIVINNHGQAINDTSGIVIVNVHTGQEEREEEKAKKHKVNHVEDTCSRKVEDEEDLWEAWRQFMERCCYHDFWYTAISKSYLAYSE